MSKILEKIEKYLHEDFRGVRSLPGWSGAVPGKYKVDVNIVKERDTSPPYIKLVQDEIRKGKGFVSIATYDNGVAGVYAWNTNLWVLGSYIHIPAKALTEVK